jgi:orotate phosphoribosyltransferase
MNMNYEQLAKNIYKASYLTGKFKLHSGEISNEYFDKYLFESDPRLLSEIADVMCRSIPNDTKVLAGMEIGGIPLAVVLSQKTGLQACFVRKEAKGYGQNKIAEGISVRGQKVCLIEDVVTTGDSSIDAVTKLRLEGAKIDTVLCVILRDEKANANFAEHRLKLVPAFTMKYIKEVSNGNALAKLNTNSN